MRNKINRINREDLKRIVDEKTLDKKVYIVGIDGKEIDNINRYLEVMEIKFKFPTRDTNWNGYLDWIRDLDWLHKEEYILIIYNYDEFLKQDLKIKKQVMEEFEDMIFPYWEDYNRNINGNFNVYIVE